MHGEGCVEPSITQRSERPRKSETWYLGKSKVSLCQAPYFFVLTDLFAIIRIETSSGKAYIAQGYKVIVKIPSTHPSFAFDTVKNPLHPTAR